MQGKVEEGTSGWRKRIQTQRYENKWHIQKALNRALYLERKDEVRKTSEIKLKKPIRARVRQAKEFTFNII